jgi:hypothetical protein
LFDCRGSSPLPWPFVVAVAVNPYDHPTWQQGLVISQRRNAQVNAIDVGEGFKPSRPPIPFGGLIMWLPWQFAVIGRSIVVADRRCRCRYCLRRTTTTTTKYQFRAFFKFRPAITRPVSCCPSAVSLFRK